MNLKDIENKLKAKFNEDEIEFRVGATNSDKSMGLALAYVSARAIQNRLDEVLGFNNWKVAYKEVTGGYLCSLSIRVNDEWITKEDGANETDFEAIKGGLSNALKRVASSGFGIGRYLYDLASVWYPIKETGRSYIFTQKPEISYVTDDSKQDISQKETNKKVILNFGKYKGKSIEEVFKTDLSYIQYLIDKAKDKEIVKECLALLKKGA